VSGRRLPDNTPPHPSREGSGWQDDSPPVRRAAVAMVRRAGDEWSMREVELMRELGHLGAYEVQRALLAECGTRRTIRSIQIQASRFHVSLKVRPVCPECGVVGVRLNRQSGMCPACTERMHLAEEVAFNEVLQREREEKASEAEVAEIARERAAMRKRNSRLCSKYGLKTRRQRKG